MNKNVLDEWQVSLETELHENLLSYWIEQAQDRENGGFYGRITNQNEIKNEAPKGLILNTRILWTFSAAYRLYNKAEYLAMAERAYKYVQENFVDKKYKGAFWMLD